MGLAGIILFRVAAEVDGEGDFRGFTLPAIHFRRVAAKANAIDDGADR